VVDGRQLAIAAVGSSYELKRKKTKTKQKERRRKGREHAEEQACRQA
jgi:hypothetical protein